MEKINTKLSEFLKDVIDNIRKPVMSILPGQLSFFLLLSLIPIILIIGIIASSISIDTNDIINIIRNSLPSDTSALIVPLLSGRGIDYNIIILIVSALLLVSKGTRSIMRVASIIYGTRDKYNLQSILKSFILAVLLVLLFAFLLIIPVLGTRILNTINNFKIVSSLTDEIIFLYNVLKWPITMFVIFISLKALYTFAPNKKIPSESVNKGAAFTSISWIIVTALYSFYITHLSSYNIFYGGASNLIILMLWVYLISYIFVLGMSINASYLKNQQKMIKDIY